LSIEYSNKTPYYRTVSIPTKVTVIQPIKFENLNALYLSPFNASQATLIDKLPDSMTNSSETPVAEQLDANYHFLFLCNFSNVWNEVLRIKLFTNYDGIEELVFDSEIHPKSSKRVIIPLKRICLDPDTLAKPIPTAADKQFVLKRNAGQAFGEKNTSREVFWYKQYMIGNHDIVAAIRASWEVSDNCRGSLSLRELKFKKEMIQRIRMQELLISGTVLDRNGQDAGKSLSTCTTYTLSCSVLNASSLFIINIREFYL
jgi:hypothetical protein